MKLYMVECEREVSGQPPLDFVILVAADENKDAQDLVIKMKYKVNRTTLLGFTSASCGPYILNIIAGEVLSKVSDVFVWNR